MAAPTAFPSDAMRDALEQWCTHLRAIEGASPATLDTTFSCESLGSQELNPENKISK